MSIVVFRIFILLTISLQIFALDETFVNKMQVCQRKKSSFSAREISWLKESHSFPLPGDGLGSFIERIENWDRQNKKMTLTCSARQNPVELKPPAKVSVVLANIAKQTTALIIKDMENQQRLIEKGRICSGKLVELERGGRFIEKVQESDFAGLDGVSTSECMFFVKNFIPEIQRRFKLMRQMMALMDPPVQAGKTLEHDRPFSFDLTKSFFPGIWKKKTAAAVAPLTEQEAKEALDPQFAISPEGAKHAYYQLLSTTPMLLFFDKKVEAPHFEYAFEELRAQNKMDIESFKKNPSQDIMLLTPYVFSALEKLPPDEVGDACMVVGQIYKNLGIYYEKVPQLVAQAGLVFALWGGLEAMAAKKFFSTVMSRAGTAGTIYGGVVAKDSLEKYSAAVARCSTLAAESNSDPAVPGLCDFKYADDKYRDAQTQVVVSALMGSLVYGYGRFFRPPAN